MPRDERKRQKALMKKRSKEKVAAQSRVRARHIAASFSEQSLIRRAREFPILECRVSTDWEKEEPGLVQVLVAR